MKKIDLKNSSFVIRAGLLIKDAMEAITDNQRGCVVVADDNFTLQGIASDGDIRRAMLKGATLQTPILKVLNTNPVVVFSSREAEDIFQKESSINVLPVVNKNNKLIDVAIRDPQVRKEL